MLGTARALELRRVLVAGSGEWELYRTIVVCFCFRRPLDCLLRLWSRLRHRHRRRLEERIRRTDPVLRDGLEVGRTSGTNTEAEWEHEDVM